MRDRRLAAMLNRAIEGPDALLDPIQLTIARRYRNARRAAPAPRPKSPSQALLPSMQSDSSPASPLKAALNAKGGEIRPEWTSTVSGF